MALGIQFGGVAEHSWAMDQRSREPGRTRDGGSLRASAVRTGVSAALIVGLLAVLPLTSTSDVTSVVVLVVGVILLGIIVAVRVSGRSNGTRTLGCGLRRPWHWWCRCSWRCSPGPTSCCPPPTPVRSASR